MGMFSSDSVIDSDSSQTNSLDGVREIEDKIKDIERDIITEEPVISPKVTVAPKILSSTVSPKVNQLVTESDLQTTVKLTEIEPAHVSSTKQPVLLESPTTRRKTSRTTSTTPRTPATTIAQDESLFSTLTLPTTPFNHFTTEANLIVPPKKRKEDNMFMLLTGRDEDCQKLESWAPHFTKFIGTAFLPTIDAIVSCGYTHIIPRSDDPSNNFDDYPMTSCSVYY